MRFSVRVVDAPQQGIPRAMAGPSSSVRTLQLSANSEAALREQLLASGQSVLEVRRLKDAVMGHQRLDVAWWCRELATLLRAGMTVVEAIDTLHLQSKGSDREAIHAQLMRGLHEGQTLSLAMKSAEVFPLVLVAGITASERTGNVIQALDDFLRYDAMLARLRKQVVSAAIYPAVVAVLGAVIALFLVLYVVPRFTGMYADFHGEKSLATQLLLGLSTVLREHAGLALMALALASAAVLWSWQRGWLLAGLVRGIEAVAVLREQVDHFRLAKLYQSLALMFRGGYAMDEALAVCEGLGLGHRLSACVAQARRDVIRGRAVSAALAEAGLSDVVTTRLLAVGERTGAFDVVLQTISERHSETFTTFVERLTRLVEPLMLLSVALVVGAIVVAMYMPIFDIAAGIR